MSSGVFKFLHAGDLPRLMDDSTLKIASSSYFRREYTAMEVKDAKINDPEEGRVWHVQRQPLGPDSTEAEKAAFRQMFGQEYAGGLVARNLILHHIPNFHMLCFAKGELAALAQTFCARPEEESGFAPYTACVEILDPRELGRAILYTGSVAGTVAPAAQLWKGFWGADVKYEPIAYDWSEAAPRPDPFRKHVNFADQCETRLVFDPTTQAQAVGLNDVLIIHVPDLKRHLRVVDLPEGER